MPVPFTPVSSNNELPFYNGYDNGYDNGAVPNAANMNPAYYGSMATGEALFDINNMELFEGFDIPFWLDDDQYGSFLENGT